MVPTLPLRRPSEVECQSQAAAILEEEHAYGSAAQVHVEECEEATSAVEGEELNHRGVPKFSWRKLIAFTGPGFLMSIAYLDPGNIESDLQAGAKSGYALLWVLLGATAMGLFLQLLSARVGVATGLHLAELCRKQYPAPARWALWLLTEIAICGSDIQEVIGSAIAFRILSRGFIPLWAGVLITAVDGFLFLSLESFGVRKLEALFGGFIVVMMVSFFRMFIETEPNLGQIAKGLIIPSVPRSATGIAVGVIGSVVMPHNIFLHSALVQSRAVDHRNEGKVREALRYYSVESTVALIITFLVNLSVVSVFAKLFAGTETADKIGLLNAGNFLQEAFGTSTFPVLYIWAVGLLAAGQSSTMTGTYAGQFVMAGFLNLRVKKWTRVVITRSVSIVPTVAVALLFDQSERRLDLLNEGLNMLQAVQLPFALLPLLLVVSSPELMGVFVINRRTKVIASLISVLVIGINLYLLYHVAAVSFPPTRLGISLACTGGGAYLAFIAYLVVGPTSARRIFQQCLKSTDSWQRLRGGFFRGQAEEQSPLAAPLLVTPVKDGHL